MGDQSGGVINRFRLFTAGLAGGYLLGMVLAGGGKILNGLGANFLLGRRATCVYAMALMRPSTGCGIGAPGMADRRLSFLQNAVIAGSAGGQRSALLGAGGAHRLGGEGAVFTLDIGATFVLAGVGMVLPYLLRLVAPRFLDPRTLVDGGG